MVIRGRVAGRVCTQAPRRRKPDWDNNIHDLKTLKLTPAELEAKLKSFKSKEWSRPKRAPSSGRSNSSRDSEGNAPTEADMSRINIRKETVSVKQTSVCTSDEEDDFDEDIRRLESLQTQQPKFLALQNSIDGVGCSQQFLRGSPNLLEYLETEMQKAWSEMSITKEKKVTKRQKPIRRRIKLQLGGRKRTSAQELKILDVILANQQSSALSMNQSFAQELHNHVVYQQHVIQELNEFRISATRELMNLVTLVQKLLSVQEAKYSSQPRPDEVDGHAQAKDAALSDDIAVVAKDKALNDNSAPETGSLKVATNTTPPKPRQIPIFLKKRTSTVRPTQLQGPQAPALPDIKKASAQEGVKEKESVLQSAGITEVRRRPLSAKTTEDLAGGSCMNSKDLDRGEHPSINESSRRLPAPSHVSKPAEELASQDHRSSEALDRRENARFAEENQRRLQSTYVSKAKDGMGKEGAPEFNKNENARITENKRRLPSTNVSKPTEEHAKEGQVSSADEFDRRENPLFESDVHGKSIAIPRGPFKKSRLQEHSASPRWKLERSAHATDRPGNEQIVPAASPNAKPSARKPNVDHDRFVTISRKQQRPGTQQEGPSKARTQVQRPDGRSIGPRYRLQGWSAAFIQTERLRGKENNLQRRKF